MVLNKKLGEHSPGDQLEIVGFCLEEDQVEDHHQFLHRLSEVGFLVGEPVEVIGHAPYSKDPISVKVKEATYALRREDANLIYVKKR
jgi:Fe2+ transport system protein FeoA